MPLRRVGVIAAAAALFAVPAVPVCANDEGAAFFERRIRPILVRHCYECHSEEAGKRKGGLLLDRESGWKEGGRTGKAIVPGVPGASLLVEAIGYGNEDLQMPPTHPLADSERSLLVEWVRRGAPGPVRTQGEGEGEGGLPAEGGIEGIFARAAEHWSLQPVRAGDLPEVDHPGWRHNPVDRFVFSRLAREGITPSPQADSHTLTRRISYALTGLPPGDDEWYELAPEELIDRLLDSPRFGEHFARMWLDVARYADTAITYRADTKTPHYYPYAFTYRDYVIEAFNEDTPFDQFVREQLAADLIAPDDEEPELAALGFLGVSPHRSMGPDFVDDLIDTTTRGLLGMTVSCARCHDHKFEPIPIEDYYSLYGVFASLDRPEPWKLEAYPEISGYEALTSEREDYAKKRAEIDREIEEAGDKTLRANNRSVADSIEQTSLAELLLFHDGAPVRAMAVGEREKPVTPSVFERGDPSNRGERVPRRFLRILDPDQEAFARDNSGRVDLAEHIVDPANPLTARVYVNRVWGRLMGDHLVDTPSDFGFEGEKPSHPALLDFLAADFMANGWSTKQLVRRIVTSRAFQQSSRDRPEVAEIDPENELYGKANRRRLQIEELRDSLLALSGNLDLRMRGRPGEWWGESAMNRRSIYGYVNRFNLDPTLRNFDYPSPTSTHGSRPSSIVSQQALFLMNSPFLIEQSAALVERIGFANDAGHEERTRALFREIFDREPHPWELTRVHQFARIEENRNVDPWPLVAQSLAISNEFLYVD